MLKEIILILTLMTPPGQEDVRHAQKMENIGDCWKAAQEFMETGLSKAMRDHGVVGKGATCAAVEAPSTDG